MAANTLYPPGPNLGILGIGGLRRIRDDLLTHCVDLANRFGDCVHYRVGVVDCFHFSHPDQIRDVLVHQHESFQRPSRCRTAFRGWYGEGILLNEGQLWNEHRQLVQRLLERGGITQHSEIVDELTAKCLNTWDRSVVDIGDFLARLSFQVLAKSLWGGEADDMAGEFVRLIATLQYWSMRALAAPVSLPAWIPGASRRQLRTVMRSLNAMVAEIIVRHRQGGGQGILAELFRDGDSQEIHLVTASNLLLGSETTATALTWTAHLLATHPEIQSLARNEVRSVRNGTGESAPAGGSLPYTEAVFNEAIRLYPPVYVLIREAIRPVEIGDYVLRTGSQVFLPIYVTHRDQRWFEAPNTFRPERFLNGVSEPRRFAYLPFGAGPRHCIGRQLGLATAVRILAAMLRYGCLTLPEGAKEPDFEPLISLRPRTPIRVKVNGL